MTARPDRRAWLDERRAAVVARYDAEAVDYDSQPYPTTSHVAFVARVLDMCPAGGTVLDAPCGTGQYFEQVRATGREVVGIDQSAGMLAQAEAKGTASRVEQVGLQEMAFDAEFDASMTIDAMENIPPEDWPRVIANLHRAVRPGGHVYLTVEIVEDADIDDAFTANVARGWPAIRDEIIEGDTAGYHYYSLREQVLRWIEQVGLDVVEEGSDHEAAWGYWHLILQRRE